MTWKKVVALATKEGTQHERLNKESDPKPVYTIRPVFSDTSFLTDKGQSCESSGK